MTLDAALPVQALTPTEELFAIADGARVVSAEGNPLGDVSGGVQIWQTASGQGLVSIDTKPSAYGVESVFVAVSPDGNAVAVADWNGAVTLFGASDGARRVSCRAHQGSALAVAFSPAGGALASGGDDKMVVLDDPSTGVAILALADQSLAQTITDSGRAACDRMGRAPSLGCTCDEVCTCDELCTCEAVCT